MCYFPTICFSFVSNFFIFFVATFFGWFAYSRLHLSIFYKILCWMIYIMYLLHSHFHWTMQNVQWLEAYQAVPAAAAIQHTKDKTQSSEIHLYRISIFPEISYTFCIILKKFSRTVCHSIRERSYRSLTTIVNRQEKNARCIFSVFFLFFFSQPKRICDEGKSTGDSLLTTTKILILNFTYLRFHWHDNIYDDDDHTERHNGNIESSAEDIHEPEFTLLHF